MNFRDTSGLGDITVEPLPPSPTPNIPGTNIPDQGHEEDAGSSKLNQDNNWRENDNMETEKIPNQTIDQTVTSDPSSPSNARSQTNSSPQTCQ